LKDEEAIDWCKSISKFSWDKGNKLREGHGGLPKGRLIVYVKKKKKKGRRMNVRKIVLVLMCAEVLMGRVCVRIKH
jgi:hypothetical protein